MPIFADRLPQTLRRHFSIDNLLKRLGFYLISASVLFYFAAPYFGLTAGINILFSVGLAPILVEGARFAFNFAYQNINALVQFHLAIRPRRELEQAIQQQDVQRANTAIQRIQSAHGLMPSALALMPHTAGSQHDILLVILARLQSLEPQERIANNFSLLKEAASQQNEEILRNLIALDDIQHANADHQDLAWRALCGACRQGNLVIVEMLLSLPIVLARVTHDNNRALRLANSFNRFDVVARLLDIPAVAQFTLQTEPENPAIVNQTVRGLFRLFSPRTSRSRRPQNLEVDERQDNELGGLSQAFEGAMTPLNDRQLQALDDMQTRYIAQYNAIGERTIFNEIRAFLTNEYDKNPVRDTRNQPLPLLRSVNYSRRNNSAYYQHAVHGAYRYLFMRPNPWESRESTYHSGDMSSQDKHRIAFMWLAATDKTRALPEGQTNESLLVEFTQAIYELCRAHNFDQTRRVEKKRKNTKTGLEETYFIEESYDDMHSDKPTCGAGVSQRVTQFYMVFLNDRPETRPLTPDLWRTKFKEEMINESLTPGCMYQKLKAMDVDTLKDLQVALEKQCVLFDELSEKEQTNLALLNFSEQEINAFNDLCKSYYGPKRITQKREGNEKLKLLPSQDLFDNYEAMAASLATQAAGLFYNDVTRNMQHLIDNQSAQKEMTQFEQKNNFLRTVRTNRPLKRNRH